MEAELAKYSIICANEWEPDLKCVLASCLPATLTCVQRLPLTGLAAVDASAAVATSHSCHGCHSRLSSLRPGDGSRHR